MSWQRIDNFRVKTGKNLDQVAEAIGVGKSMLMMVKSGKRHLGRRALYRLEEAERAAGIAPPENITEYHFEEKPLLERAVIALERLERTVGALERIASALEKLTPPA